MSLFPLMMTLGGEDKKLEVPVVMANTANIAATTLGVIVTDYVGPGKLSKIDYYLTLDTDVNFTSPVDYSSWDFNSPVTTVNSHITA